MSTPGVAPLRTVRLRLVAGFTLIEFLVVMAIMGVFIAIGQPFVKNLLVEGRVYRMVEDLSLITHQLRAQGALALGTTATPYAVLGTPAEARAAAANSANGRTKVISVQGAGTTATMTHDLGATGAPVLVQQAQVVQMGDAFDITINQVSRSACPILVAQMDRRIVAASVNGTSVKTVLTPLDLGMAELACLDGEVNVYVFTFQ